MDQMLDEAVEWESIFLGMEMIVPCTEQWMVPKARSTDSSETPKPFPGVAGTLAEGSWGWNNFNNNTKTYAFFTDGVRTIRGKTAAFARVKAMALNFTSSHRIRHHDAVGKKMPVSFKNVIDDIAEIINLIKAWRWSTGVFNISWWNGKHALSTAAYQVWWLSWGKALVPIIHCFSGNSTVTWMTDKQWLFRVGYVASRF